MATNSIPRPAPALTFSLSNANASSKFGPRTGRLAIRRPSYPAEGVAGEGTSVCNSFDTPALLTSTSRGVVPHLSRDHLRNSNVKWLWVPFESFLEQDPPLPTLHLPSSSPSPSISSSVLTNPNVHRLHRHLGLDPNTHLVSLVLRDPYDTRDIPTNGKDFVSALCLRGVRKVSPPQWSTYALATQPDIVLALADDPVPSHSVNQGQRTGISQKRLTKSIERGREWLAQLIAAVFRGDAAPAPPSAPTATTTTTPVSATPTAPTQTPGIFVSLAGSTSPAARMAFARSLLEPLPELEAAPLGGLNHLDEGVSGYVVDLVGLRRGLEPASTSTAVSASAGEPRAIPANLTPPIPGSKTHKLERALLHASLGPLPSTKPRLVTGTSGPHDILRLVRDVGLDGVDAAWAVHAGGRGIAMEFEFPAGAVPIGSSSHAENGEKDIGAVKKQLGRNLYDVKYALDFRPLSAQGVCACIACKPVPVPGERRIVHSEVDIVSGALSAAGYGATRDGAGEGKAPYTRAYIHHLLHTHEMSAHALLVAHNLATVERFLEDIRRVLGSPTGTEIAADEEELRCWNFEEEIHRFEATYAELDEEEGVVSEARVMWAAVERARGKGRLGREREKAELEGERIESSV